MYSHSNNPSYLVTGLDVIVLRLEPLKAISWKEVATNLGRFSVFIKSTSIN